MANIPCRWKVEVDGVNLYDDETGHWIAHFLEFEIPWGNPELSTDVYCEWDGENIAYRWEDGIETITYREG